MTIADVIAAARREKRTVLTEVEAKEVVRQAGVPVVETKLATSKREAVATAQAVGYPVVLKIASPDIIHKSDIGGVKMNLRSGRQVAAAWDEIMEAAKRASPKASILGASVQGMAAAGTEVIIGGTKDPQFGPVLMFGLGGVFVEVLKDVAFRVVPITQRDARQMVRDIKGFPVLEGYRGQGPVDLAALEGALLNTSRLLEQHPEIKELDLNPIFAYRKGISAVDARIILEPA
jgi:acyl-CoA synthetase (NDP forming)